MYFSTGDFDIITLDHMKVNNAFVGNTGHFCNKIDLAGSDGLDDMKVLPDLDLLRCGKENKSCTARIYLMSRHLLHYRCWEQRPYSGTSSFHRSRGLVPQVYVEFPYVLLRLWYPFRLQPGLPLACCGAGGLGLSRKN